ncbi:hypothetical protein [Rhodococcus rhodochrous]|uniref:hypothetical protein n=1 Tax=Rhodococcus rhodochrous TaxID=1829 RepID=UPI000364833E|nr:hypothetical protein [Rhodococcus rhodochrous]
MDDDVWTLAEQNWLAAIIAEIERRIDTGQYVPAHKRTPAYLHSPEEPFDPDLLSKSQLEKLLYEIEYGHSSELNWYATLFKVPNPHA